MYKIIIAPLERIFQIDTLQLIAVLGVIIALILIFNRRRKK